MQQEQRGRGVMFDVDDGYSLERKSLVWLIMECTGSGVIIDDRVKDGDGGPYHGYSEARVGGPVSILVKNRGFPNPSEIEVKVTGPHEATCYYCPYVQKLTGGDGIGQVTVPHSEGESLVLTARLDGCTMLIKDNAMGSIVYHVAAGVEEDDMRGIIAKFGPDQIIHQGIYDKGYEGRAEMDARNEEIEHSRSDDPRWNIRTTLLMVRTGREWKHYASNVLLRTWTKTDSNSYAISSSSLRVDFELFRSGLIIPEHSPEGLWDHYHHRQQLSPMQPVAAVAEVAQHSEVVVPHHSQQHYAPVQFEAATAEVAQHSEVVVPHHSQQHHAPVQFEAATAEVVQHPEEDQGNCCSCSLIPKWMSDFINKKKEEHEPLITKKNEKATAAAPPKPHVFKY